MAVVALSVVERRLDAVRAVLSGAPVAEVARGVGVSRQSLHTWVARYLLGGVAGLANRSSRPMLSPSRAPDEVEAAVAELRREHPRWGARRIRLELLRADPPWHPGEGLDAAAVPSTATINRILLRHGLVKPRPRKRPRSSFVRFERPGPMQLWGIDIVGGIELVNPVTGELREAKIVTGVDDHSRFCVMAQVVERATGRAVCLAFAKALAAYGVPEEVITDNGKQFTARFAKGGEALFDKICRNNAITHRLTQPASPNQNGKVERFHGTFRPEISEQGPFVSLVEAQGAVDVWVAHYNAERPHQALDEQAPVMPADRFTPTKDEAMLPLWVPPSLEIAPGPAAGDAQVTAAVEGPVIVATDRPRRVPGSGAPVELDKVAPASGNMTVGRQQVWLGPERSGQVVRVWADCDWLHLSIGAQRIKTLRSRLTVNDLDVLAARGAWPAGDPPAAARARAREGVVEVERTVARTGNISLGNKAVAVAELLAGRRVGVWIEDHAPLIFFDPATRTILRTRPNTLSPGDQYTLQQAVPTGERPRPAVEPVTVQRRASATGIIAVAGQKVPLGRIHAGATVTVHAAEATLAIELPDGDTRVVRRTNDNAVRSMKGQRPRTA
ncbi:IS481 family transposase [Isoptericola sp. NEAU-Y5]|uniref:IS481 family transposase n=1 Tax=Isoptericola luteus TaxID=2879484 RepID=A0ABS7ZHB3_9MICO|nr:IS481 family transposase [Isoptericola sp. NEAU-Y5]MCA5894313.1 IS481 family transposase [Isoptericola sp. NEAU-Y5]